MLTVVQLFGGLYHIKTSQPLCSMCPWNNSFATPHSTPAHGEGVHLKMRRRHGHAWSWKDVQNTTTAHKFRMRQSDAMNQLMNMALSLPQRLVPCANFPWPKRRGHIIAAVSSPRCVTSPDERTSIFHDSHQECQHDNCPQVSHETIKRNKPTHEHGNTRHCPWFSLCHTCRKRETLSPGPCNSMMCNASVHTLHSREALGDASSSSDQASPSVSHIGLFGQPILLEIHLRLFLPPQLCAR